jgi:hypothetical protein
LGLALQRKGEQEESSRELKKAADLGMNNSQHRAN